MFGDGSFLLCVPHLNGLFHRPGLTAVKRQPQANPFGWPAVVTGGKHGITTEDQRVGDLSEMTDREIDRRTLQYEVDKEATAKLRASAGTTQR